MRRRLSRAVGILGFLSVAPVMAAADGGVAEPYCAPGTAITLLEQGRALQRQKGEGGAAEAVRIYRQALAADPKCAAAWWEIGWSLQLQGDWKGNVEAWERVRQLAPAYPELEAQLANAQRQRDQAASLGNLPPVGKLKAREIDPSKGESITIAAVGDVHMGMAWPEDRPRLPPDGGADLFESVTASLQSADVTFGNLETAIADSGDSKKCGPRSTKCFAFRVPSAYAAVLKQAGFGVMSIANNHAGDFGPEGRRSTMAALDAAGIHHSGPVGDIASWEVKGKKVAMAAFSYGAGVYRIQELETGRRLVHHLKATHDLVLVSFHAGAEGAGAERTPKGVEKFLGENRGDSRAFARAMIDAGADLLLGHGPHVLRGMEIYKGRLILYSMGNFSSWQTFGLSGTKGITGIFKASLAPNGVIQAVEVEPLFIEEPGRPRPDPQRRAIEQLRKLSKEDFGAELLDENGVWQRSPGS